MVTHLELDGDFDLARYYSGSINLKYQKNSDTSKSIPPTNTFIFTPYQFGQHFTAVQLIFPLFTY